MRSCLPSVALAGLIVWAGDAARADLTAEMAWSRLQAGANAAGLSVNAATSVREERGLRLAGVFAGPALATEVGGPRLLVPEVRLTERADGGVDVALPGRIELFLVEDVRVVLHQRNLVLVLRDSDGGLTAEGTADELALSTDIDTLFELPDGQIESGVFTLSTVMKGAGFRLAPAPAGASIALGAATWQTGMTVIDPVLAEDLRASATTADVDMTLRLEAPADAPVGALAEAALAIRTGAFTIGTVAATGPAPGMRETTDVASDSLSMTFEAAMPLWLATADPADLESFERALRDGAVLSFQADLGAGTSTSEMTGGFPNYSATSIVGPSGVSLRIDRRSLLVEARQGAGQGILRLPDMSFPEFRIGYGPMDVRFDFPVLADNLPSAYALKVALTDLTVNDAAWDLVDPRRAVPRDPASLVLDAVGITTDDLAEWAESIDVTGNPPEGWVQEFDLRQLLVAFGGARFSAQGSLRADPAVKDADGLNIPFGSFRLELAGGDALIDALEATGLIPAEELASVRRDLQAFWPDPEGTDQRRGLFEARQDGTATLNGRPLD